MMTGRDRVKACLTFKSPDRVPRDLWTLPYVTLFQKEELSSFLEEFPMDIEFACLSDSWRAKLDKFSARVGNYTDEWGSVWRVAELGVCGEVKKPVLEDWSALNKLKPPFKLIRDRDWSFINKYCEQSNKFIISDNAARPFERLQFLRGTANLYMDIAYGDKRFYKLLQMVNEYNIEDIKCWCKTNVDGVHLMDDWGSNLSLLINPTVWRDIFKTIYKEYCDIIHSAGKFVFFHSDGNIEAIFGDLIEIGVDAINSQLFIMNIEELGKKYKGKITFWGEIDRQYVLPFGTPQTVHEAVMRVRRVLDNSTGGVIAQCEWGKNNPTDNIRVVFRAWDELLNQ
jgi:hypothetical protein